VFRLNDDDKLEYNATAEDSELDNIEAAIDVCPMQAISLVD
jgi:ferredoxin